MCGFYIMVGNCQIQDCQEILVTRDFKVYFPNIFSPHGGIQNNTFTIHSNDPNAIIEEMQVFDRWGNMVYSVKQRAMEGDAAGWDGTFNGEYVNPGVYVFKADLRFEDGSTDTISGQHHFNTLMPL